MLTIQSFLIRLKPKSALYFSIVPALAYALMTRSIAAFFQSLCLLSVGLYFLSALLLSRLRKRKTGISCRICGYNHCVPYYKARRRGAHLTQGSFACSSFDHGQYPDIHFCPECKNAFLSSILSHDESALNEETQKTYAEVVDQTYIENLPQRHETYRRFLARYQDFFRGKDVLEVGCYYGAFAEVVQPAAKSYLGLEPSRHACSFLKSKYPGIHLINGAVESLEERKDLRESFDTIVLFDVIEHVVDPIKMLTQLKAFLRPGGHIIFSTINIESSFSMALGPFWPWYMDMHLYYFSDSGYHTMLHRSGFYMRNHEHFPYIVSLNYFFSKVASILHLPKSWKPPSGDRIKIPIRLGDTVLIIGEKAESPREGLLANQAPA